MRAKINDETVQSMKQSLMVGLTLKEACEMEDIDVSTWRRYESKHPDIKRKRKRWQKALKVHAKANIAEFIYGNKKKDIKPDLQMSMYVLEHEAKLEAKNSQNAVNRATAVKLRAEAKRIEAETAQINGEAGASKESTIIIDDIGAIEHAKDKDVKDD
ncbi:hypothetical protein PPJ95_04935 [Limosilactobacillus reuteri]|uniref:hypothetical protein n=1 Tax=Limosilactobacillus reuteri TaxID=1598 RepID=UPI00234ABCA1|nr:hypothetical protein [Limosilactobacillus reuteri]MDC6076915.1 hypothetical protein [Limosilactobacillus reuteri]